jgi:cell division septum initiation protein DivIVA
VAGVLRAAEEAAEKIRADARAEAATILDQAQAGASSRIEELTREAEGARSDAEDYAQDVRSAVNSYGTQQRREAEEEARGIVADAEDHARAVREAAQDMAGRIEGEARTRHETLRDEIRILEEHRQHALDRLRDLVLELNDFLPEASPPGREEPALLSSLQPERQS